MKRRVLWSCLAALLWLAAGAATGVAARAEEADALPEWTVMMYMCGSDLESRNGLATYNLQEIASTHFPKFMMSATEQGPQLVEWQGGRAKVLVETGGSSRWHGMDEDGDGRSLGVDIATDRLQRYAYSLELQPYGYAPTLSLVDEQPLASMGDPRTLSDFIQWCAREYPAKKYMLLLWDHGGGSRTGLFVDELFENDTLYLYELGQALADGGVSFDLVAIDACLMCSLETARMIAPYAKYMVASEEVAAGYGSAFAGWMYELFRNPGCSGDELGIVFCDATQRKYDELDDVIAETQLTYSVIDLGMIDAVAEAFDRAFDFVGQLYEAMPESFNTFANVVLDSEAYGMDGMDMLDMGSFLFNEATTTSLDRTCRNDLMTTMTDAVFYTVKGSGRSESRGLSFCYAPNMSPEEMDIYALNCQSAPYLALLDAVNPDWSAPDWVYERARRLIPVEEIEDYHMTMELGWRDELPALFLSNEACSFYRCYFNLFREDEDLGELCLLGCRDTLFGWDDQTNRGFFTINELHDWPAIDGELCCLELIKNDDDLLYNVPIRIGSEINNLRLSVMTYYDEAADRLAYHFESLGLWQGYDRETRMPNRAVMPLAQLQGREYEILYPYYSAEGERTGYYLESRPLTMYRALELEHMPLPVGDYCYSFSVEDVFRNHHETELVRVHWDGERAIPVE